MDQEEKKYKRRERYKGTHPKNFKEKYKEHQPEKYGDTIEKVIQKGSTPAGMHISICVQEILAFLQIKPGQVGFDATLGYGGHTLEMLKCLGHKGHVHATDLDPIEIVKTTDRLRSNGFGPEDFTSHNMSFTEIDKVATQYGPFDFVLADLGVSSMQIDNPERGFSYKLNGPLDLRLNPTQGIPASERLKELDRDELIGLLMENADEPYAKEIAKAMMLYIKRNKGIETTTELREIIQGTLKAHQSKPSADDIKKSCQRCFQALRIEVNNELGALYDFLEKLPDALSSGGRVAILTFHSGEDRLVKKAFQRLHQAGVFSEIAPAPIRPSAEECVKNPRARSTKMRWAVKK